MSFLSKLLAAGVGFVVAGPIGALIGISLSSAFSNNNQTNDNNTHKRTQKTYESDFKVSLLVLIACVMKADGAAKKVELNVVKRFLIKNFNEQEALEALQILKNLLKQQINETDVAMQISRYMNYSTKLELIHLLLDIAYADGNVSNNELIVIKRIANIFAITQADFTSLQAMYIKQQDNDWMYKVLQIDKNVSDEEVKKAYRRMAMKYHPDKVNAAGEDAKKSATEKFRKINEAYEEIKKSRGMK